MFNCRSVWLQINENKFENDWLPDSWLIIKLNIIGFG